MYADVAQLVEHAIGNGEVSGSIPDVGSTIIMEKSVKKESYAVASLKAFIVKDGKVLILEESSSYKGGTQHGNFVMPGGKVNEGQNLNSSLKREIKEECGGSLRVKIGRPFHIDEWKVNVPGKPKHIVATYIECVHERGEVNLNDEFKRYLWIDPRKYAKYKINAAAKRAFRSYLKQS